MPGHELAGRIAAIGAGVEGWRVGDRVVALPFAQCGRCERCRSGEEQVCKHAVADGVGLGTGRPGGYSERVVVDAAMLFAIPDELDDRIAALTEPVAVAVHAIAKARIAPGDPIAVVGTGPIGMLTGLVLRAQGHDRVVVVSRNAGRTRAAQALGLRTVELDGARDAVPEALGAAPTAVLECAGSPSAANLAVELAAPLGRVVLVGIALEPLDLVAPLVVLKEVAIVGALTYRRAEFAAAIELLNQGRIPAAELISDVAALEAAEEMFRALVAPGNARLKVLLAP